MEKIRSEEATQGWYLSSMTGYGSAQQSNENYQIKLTIKSVNHRHLDLRFRFPEELSFLEAEATSLIKKALSRGHIDIAASIDVLDPEAVSIFDEERAKVVVQSVMQLAERFEGISKTMSIGDLLSIPGLLVKQSLKSESEIKGLGLNAIFLALEDFRASRVKEGGLLGIDIEAMLARSLDLIIAIKAKAKEDAHLRFARFKDRVKGLFEHYSINEDRLYQEFALLTERADFTEEIARLNVHIEHFNTICQSSEFKGRKLDFLCQEMLRESNTLMSKAGDAAITVLAIELKAELERIREQVQNIE